MAGTGLELNLVVNPAGAFLPADQCQMEKKYKSDLERRWGITFNNLFSFANVPLGRFRKWLLHSGNYGQYLGKLAGHFNPHTIPGLMCRTLVTVSWDGYLYDCDFNLAADLPLGKEKIHVTGLSAPPSSDSPIAVGDHCFACTAGSGFT
jgi:radical SAM/Cys-rich protein